jgi:hypothetical protein
VTDTEKAEDVIIGGGEGGNYIAWERAQGRRKWCEKHAVGFNPVGLA